MYPNDYIDYNQIIENIAQNFYLIDENYLIKLPKTILHLVISKNNFRSKNEDSLFNLLVRKLDQNDEEDSFDKNQFLEQINFEYLSPNNFDILIHRIDKVSGQLWNNIVHYMLFNFHQTNVNKLNQLSRSYIYQFEFDEKKKMNINHLTLMCNGNIGTKNVIKLKVSSLFKAQSRSIEAIVDLKNTTTYMQFDHKIDQPNGRSFIIYIIIK